MGGECLYDAALAGKISLRISNIEFRMSNFQILGHFHPLLVHLPIGILLLAILFEFLAYSERYAHLKPTLPLMWFFGAITAIASCLTGFVLSLSGEYDTALVNQHQWTGILLAISASSMYWWKRKGSEGNSKWGSLIILLLVLAAGHLGGSLTHGADYLFKGKNVASNSIALGNVQEAMVYSDIIVPILSQRCYSCHGKNKQKGKLRLDAPEYIQKGGKSKKPINSELVHRIQLSIHDEEHMPPKEKKQLSKAEAAFLQWWMENGHPFDKKVQELEQSEEISSYLKTLEKGENVPVASKTYQKNIPAQLPEANVQPVKKEILDDLQKMDLIILPAGQGSPFLKVNFVNVTNYSDSIFSLLSSIASNMVWLRLSGQPIGNQALTEIAKMINLTHLYLDFTSIDDEGLTHVKDLQELRYLNLVGTSITASGLNQLKKLPSLDRLFIYQTQVNVSALDPALPVEVGGYKVPYFPEDTLRIPMN